MGKPCDNVVLASCCLSQLCVDGSELDMFLMHQTAAGLTISKPSNRDTVLGGAKCDEPCYLELVQPGVSQCVAVVL